MPNFTHYVNTLYHFTDSSNLESIAENGGLYSWSKLEELGISVPNPGGNEWSHDADARLALDMFTFASAMSILWNGKRDKMDASTILFP